ncbi:hypothetical protein ACFYYY_27080 [Streptomyces sp. NPDC001834]
MVDSDGPAVAVPRDATVTSAAVNATVRAFAAPGRRPRRLAIMVIPFSFVPLC